MSEAKIAGGGGSSTIERQAEWLQTIGSDEDDLLLLTGLKSQSARELCEAFLSHVVDNFGCSLATAWSLDPVRDKLLLVAFAGPASGAIRTEVLDCSEHFSGVTVRRKTVTRFSDITRALDDGRTFGESTTPDAFGLESMISVPVLNTVNLRQVLLVIDLFPCTSAPLLLTDEALENAAERLAMRVETSLRHRCMQFASRLDIELRAVAGEAEKHSFRTVAKLIQQAVGCDDVLIWTTRPYEEELQLSAIVGRVPSGRGRKRMLNRATEVWRDNRECLDTPIRRRTTWVKVARGEVGRGTPEDVDMRALLPLRDLTGRARGAVCCANRLHQERRVHRLQPFTYEEIAIVEAILQAFAPRLELLLAERKKVEVFDKLAHELRVPVVAFRAALERLQHECRTNHYDFQFDHFQELNVYCDVMRRLMTELDVVRVGPRAIELKPRPTYFLSSIIAPAKRFVAPLLRSRGFREQQIHYSGIEDIPNVYVDPVFMTQVVFNLLDNAIKYFDRLPAQFSVEIEAKALQEHFQIVFRDHGIGVPKGDEERIFMLGIQGSNVYRYDTIGQGIGLYLARLIVELHGGELQLANRKNPTEFVIALPRSLRFRSPQG